MIKLYGTFENHKFIVKNQEQAKKEGLPLVEVEQSWDGTLWEVGFCPEKPECVIKKERIDELKTLLAGADYWGQKYIDGEYTAEEWEQKKAQRKAWRAEIRELEDAEKEIDGTDNSDGG